MFVQRILPAILVVIPAAIVATAQASKSAPTVEQCKTKPGLSAARGTHWYYRFDHVAKRRCWYLGSASAGQHAGANTNTSDASETPAVASAPAVPPQKPVALQALPGQVANVQPPQLASTAAVPHVELSVRDEQNAADFAARWSDLPKLQDGSSGVAPSADLSGPELSGLRSSYADNSADEEASPQIPVTWPVVEAVSAPPDSSVFAPPSAFLVGGTAMALVFVAGWAFRHIRARRIYVVPSCAEAVRGHSPQGNKPDTIGSGGASARRAVARRRPTPTDPARDLKASLGELMRDLQRAGAAAEAPVPPIGKPKRRIAAARKVRLVEVVD
jgi:hypothetical protein